MELGKRIADIRKEHDLTQESLAEICNVTRQTISNWENGRSYPDLVTLVLISGYFEVPLDAMLKGDRTMVSEITKEQKQGRSSRIRLAVVISIAVIIIAVLLILLFNSSTALKPGEYNVTVEEITLDDVELDEAGKTAKYKDPDLDGYTQILKDGSEASEQGVRIFEGSEYTRLITSGHVYKIVFTSDKGFDGMIMGDGEDALSIEVSLYRSTRSILDGHSGEKRMEELWYTDFDTIYDAGVYKNGDIESAVVWKK